MMGGHTVGILVGHFILAMVLLVKLIVTGWT